MLESITYTTLLDDVTQHDSTTNDLQTWVAGLLGQPAGLLTSSGTMGNQLAARAHLTNPPYSVVADEGSHILSWEAGGIAANSGALPVPAKRTNGRYITLEDIQAVAILHDDTHYAPTKMVSIENTVDGVGVPVAECARICAWAREHGIKTHLDGARLWEVAAANVARNENANEHNLRAALEKEIHAYGNLFDSVTVCFSKGLGAPIGSILVGSEVFIKQARHVRKSWGGGMRQTGIIAAPARVAVEDTFFSGQLVRSHEVAKRIAKSWTDKGGKLTAPVDTNMVWIDLSSTTRQQVWLAEAEREGLHVYGGARGRIVVHYQICEEAVERLGRVFDKVIAEDRSSVVTNGVKQGEFGGYTAIQNQAKYTERAGDGDEV